MFNFAVHSSEEEVHLPVLTKHQVQLFIKRDDLIHPFISGNKWRKLKYNLEEAHELGKKHLVSFGGAYSNHILALACAGAKFNFQTSAFIRGEEVNNEMLAICKIFGMQLIFTDRTSYKDKIKLYNDFAKTNEQTYFIDEGGAGKLAEKGCREIVKELAQEYDELFCAAGTGTTVAGIINQVNSMNLKTNIHIISVLKCYESMNQDINQLLDNRTHYHIHHDYHFGGYAKTKPELLDTIKDFASQTGILTDPVYTGKTIYAVLDQVQKGAIKKGSKVLMIHTGGLFGILGMLDKFGK